MESTTHDQQFFVADPSLSEPRFDEEATVLSARPVVPLASVVGATAVKTKSSVQPWMLGLALVAALLVGVVATAIYYSRGENESIAIDDAALSAGAAAIPAQSDNSFSGSAPAPAEPKVEAPVAQTSQSSVIEQTAKPPVAPTKKPVARIVDVIRETPRVVRQPQENRDDREDNRDDRKAARREAREERRRDKRDRRVSDDVLRIRDIFEGSPRP